MREYEDSLKAYRDIKNSLDTALEQGFERGMEKGHAKGLEEGRKKGLAEGRAKGRAEGRAEGRADVVKMMLKRGLDIKMIAELTELTEGEVESIS